MAEKEYIEREAAINGITKIISKSDMPEDWSKGMIAAMSTLYRIPAADVRPVVHGHNTGNARIFECSECGYGFDDIFLTNEHDYLINPNFCPNCGADMRPEPPKEET